MFQQSNSDSHREQGECLLLKPFHFLNLLTYSPDFSQPDVADSQDTALDLTTARKENAAPRPVSALAAAVSYLFSPICSL